MPRASGTYTAPSSSWSPAIAATSATPSDWNGLLTDLSSALTQSMSRDGTSPPTQNMPMANFKFTGLGAGANPGDSARWEQLFSLGLETDVASAATTDIGVINSLLIRVLGTTTITSFGINYNGPRFVRFAGALTLTNSATLVLPGGANITTSANQLMIITPIGNPATGWQVAAASVTNLINGSAGVIPWQSGAGVTAFTAAGTVGQVLISGGTSSPTWAGVTGTGNVVKDTGATIGTSTLNTSTINTATFKDYTETPFAIGTTAAATIAYTNGGVQYLITSANLTVTLPTAAAGRTVVLFINYGGAHTVTFAGGTLLKPVGGSFPTATSVAGKWDKYVISCLPDGTATTIADGGRAF